MNSVLFRVVYAEFNKLVLLCIQDGTGLNLPGIQTINGLLI